jgi:hypothetical protein
VSNRPPVYDPNAPKKRINAVGQLVIAVCAACGLLMVAFMVFVAIALNSYGNNK